MFDIAKCWCLTPTYIHVLCRYAREDTHFLLHIFDRMREELFRSEGRIGLAGVVDSGRELCCLRYKKEGNLQALEIMDYFSTLP